MCGIAGAVGAPAGTDLGAVGREMIGRIRHRGPDALATAILPKERGVFGHARLRIIDLSERGAQPYWDRSQQVVLIFNGEIYNYRELRRTLQHEGVLFRSESDTEVILEQYLRYGEAEPLYRDALTLYQRLLGDDHPAIAMSMNNLAGLYRSQGRYGEAEPLYLRAISVVYQRLGKNHPNTQTVLDNFVRFL